MYMDEIDPAGYVAYWKNFLKEMQQTTYRDLSKSEQEWIESIFAHYFKAVGKQPFSVRVTHSDLLPEHILIDGRTHKLMGIIDFSLRISDPAYDFSYFDRYGKQFLKTVIENYPPYKTDDTFMTRQKFYALRLGFAFLSQAKERQEEEVPVIIKQIHEYIRKNQK